MLLRYPSKSLHKPTHTVFPSHSFLSLYTHLPNLITLKIHNRFYTYLLIPKYIFVKMQYRTSTLSAFSTLLLSAVKLCSAADMSQYDPQAGVQPEFEAFLKTFVPPPLPHTYTSMATSICLTSIQIAAW